MSRPDVPRYNRIPVSYWTAEPTSHWPERIKLASLYLLTCPHRHMEGIFKLPPQYACADLHWSMKSWKTAIVVLETSGFLKWDSSTNVVLIIDALRYQIPENPNQIESVIPSSKRVARNTFNSRILFTCRKALLSKGGRFGGSSLCHTARGTVEGTVPTTVFRS